MCHCRYHRKQTLKEWIHGQCSGSAYSFSLTQMCWFRFGTFSFVLKNMSLHCSSMKGHEASKVQGITKLFWGTPHIEKYLAKSAHHGLNVLQKWSSTDSFCFPHGPFFCSQITSRVHMYFLCTDFIHEGVAAFSSWSALPQRIPGYVHILMSCIMPTLIVYWSEVVLSAILWMKQLPPA